MTSLGSFIVIAAVFFFVGAMFGMHGRKTAPAPAPPAPKIFGLSEFENFVGAIPETAKTNPVTLNVVTQAGTGLAVGLLGFEDRVVPEAEEAIAKKTFAIRQNAERTVGLQEEISEIQASISELQLASSAAQSRIDTLAELKKLKAS